MKLVRLIIIISVNFILLIPGSAEETQWSSFQPLKFDIDSRTFVSLNGNNQTWYLYHKSENEKKSALLIFTNSSTYNAVENEIAIYFNNILKTIIFAGLNSFDYDKESYQIQRVKRYLAKSPLLQNWPAIDIELKEMSNEPGMINPDNVIMTSGNLSGRVVLNSHYFNCAAFIIVSPNENIFLQEISKIKKNLENKKIIWIGSEFENSKLLDLQKIYGGKVMTFKKSGANFLIFSRNFTALDNLSSWLKEENLL